MKTNARTIRFTEDEQDLIERQQRLGETFGDTVRRMLFAAYPSLKERTYIKRLPRKSRTSTPT